MLKVITALAFLCLGACVTCLFVQAAMPLPNAHAHNDYLHEHPLFDALDRGFSSVEADIYLIDGQLLVGHDRSQLKSERTLESLYLAPLARRVRENGGHVYQDSGASFYSSTSRAAHGRPTNNSKKNCRHILKC